MFSFDMMNAHMCFVENFGKVEEQTIIANLDLHSKDSLVMLKYVQSLYIFTNFNLKR